MTVIHTEYTYACGCKAAGGPDLPQYCGEHEHMTTMAGQCAGQAAGAALGLGRYGTGVVGQMQARQQQVTGQMRGQLDQQIAQANMQILPQKDDVHKPPVYSEVLQYWPRTLRALARISAQGSKAPGHTVGGWKHVADGFKRYSEAMARHLLDEAEMGPQGGESDKHRDLVLTVVWNDLTRAEHLLRDLRDLGD